jgi:hypothetical protein
MRLNRRQPDLFEEPPRLRPIPNERRRAMVENLRALLTEALSQEANPTYAGAYAYGRSISETRIENGRKRVTRGLRVEQPAWEF